MTELVKIPAPPKKAWELTSEDIELVRNQIAKGATDDELRFCLAVARRYKLDPFRGQIWFIPRRDRTLDRYDKEKKRKVAGYRWVPIVGINGLLHIAGRDHRADFGSNDEPEFGPLMDVEWSAWEGEGDNRSLKKQKPFKAPEWAKVSVWKKRAKRPTVGIVYWQEVYPNVDSAPMARQMPRLMLGKCALAQAIRRAYPDTGGLYIKEEMLVDQWDDGRGKEAEAQAIEIDARIKRFHELTNNRVPTDDQLGRMERGESAEQVLLADSVQATESKPPITTEAPKALESSAKPKESLSDGQVQAIWPKGEVHSTERKGEQGTLL